MIKSCHHTKLSATYINGTEDDTGNRYICRIERQFSGLMCNYYSVRVFCVRKCLLLGERLYDLVFMVCDMAFIWVFVTDF